MIGQTLATLGTGELIPLTDFGAFPRWLDDSSRLIFHSGDDTASSLFLVDRETGESRELFTPEDAAARWVSISRDNRTLYFTRSSSESNIWLLTLNEER